MGQVEGTRDFAVGSKSNDKGTACERQVEGRHDGPSARQGPEPVARSRLNGRPWPLGLLGDPIGRGIISSYDMKRRAADHGLEFLLAFDGRIHHLDKGYWIKFEITRSQATTKRPHGLSYSFTLHAPDGTRLVGFDNAHDVPARGSQFKRRDEANDHWHRTEKDPGRPYMFKDAETLIDNFFDEVERVLGERGVSVQVIRVETSRRTR